MTTNQLIRRQNPGAAMTLALTARRAATMLLMMVLTTAMAWADDSGSCGDGVTYSYVESTHTLTISGTGAMANYNINNQPWYGFSITNVVIGEGVTSIGDDAFFVYPSLLSVEIPASVTSIGGSAFYNCTGLTSVSFATGSKLTSIGTYAFNNCTSLASITIPNGVTTISNNAFNSAGLTSIAIPASVTSIGSLAFYGCTSLETITVDAENAKYDSRGNCNAIIDKTSNTLVAGCKGTTIPNTVTSIGGEAFEGCSGLTIIEIPSSVTSIGNSAFAGCSGLTSIEIPSSVTSIGNYAFQHCTSLASVTIYAPSLTTYGAQAFDNNASGRKIYVPYGCQKNYKGAANWCTYTILPISDGPCGDGVNYSYDNTTHTLYIFGLGTMNSAPWRSAAYCGDIATVVIEEGVTGIVDGAFDGNAEGRKIYVPFASFATCRTGWPSYANDIIGYGNCGATDYEADVRFELAGTSTNYTLTIMKVGSTGDMANYNTDNQPWNSYKTNITSVVIEDGVTSIGLHAFYGCNYLETITVHANNAQYDSRDNCNAIIDKTNTLVVGCKGTTIPNTVTSIGEEAFAGCSGLTSIEIPSSVTSIGNSAFVYCSNLTSVTLKPTTPPSLGTSAFMNNPSSRKIYVPFASFATYKENWSEYAGDMIGYGNCGATDHEADVRFELAGTPSNYTLTIMKVGSTGAMKDYESSDYQPWKNYRANITGIVIEDGVTRIGSMAFQYSGSTSVTIPASVTTIGTQPFVACTSLTGITVDDDNAYFVSEDGVLFNKDKTTLIQYPLGNSRTEYTIPAGVQTTEEWSFSRCTTLTSVTIPASMKNIYWSAFRFCTSLASVTIYAPSLTMYGAQAFSDNAEGGRKIYVFSDCVATYKANASTMSVNSADILPITLTANEGATGEYWTTYYNELADAKVPDGTLAFKVRLSGTTLTLTEISDGIISLGTAVVIKSPSASVLPEYSETASSDTGGNDLHGTSTAITNPGNAYVLNKKSAGVGFYKLKSTGTIGAHKAYLTSGATAREYFLFDEETTGVNTLNIERKTMNGDYYDLQGRKVAQPAKGLYIVNGKKVVIK